MVDEEQDESQYFLNYLDSIEQKEYIDYENILNMDEGDKIYPKIKNQLKSKIVELVNKAFKLRRIRISSSEI